MKNSSESGPAPAATDPPDSGGGGSGTSQCASTSASGHDTGGGIGGAAYNFRLGIYGWRKRCLYILILGLLVMVIVNLALTLWVLKVMEFSSEGMGQLKIVTGGLRLEGTAYVLDSLIASSIRSRRGQPIVIESSRNLTLTTRDERGFRNNLIFLGNDRFECLSNNFKVMDDRGMLLFSADKNEVVVGADVLRITGDGGTIFSGSVQTSMVRAASGHTLRLESPTRSLDIRAPAGIHIESRSGDLNTLTLNDIKLRSTEGAIRLDAATVLMPGLPTATSLPRPSSGLGGGRHAGANPAPAHEIYQLCVCSNGKLFLVAGHSVCSADDDSLICR